MQAHELAELKQNHGGNLPAYAWPGGYPIFYVMDDGGTLCPHCANDPSNPVHPIETNETRGDGWGLAGYDVNYEDPQLYCDHCGKRIESAYAEDTKEEPKVEG